MNNRLNLCVLGGSSKRLFVFSITGFKCWQERFLIISMNERTGKYTFDLYIYNLLIIDHTVTQYISILKNQYQV
jgi:hypothetical protein